jgi:hypothetical protein
MGGVNKYKRLRELLAPLCLPSANYIKHQLDARATDNQLGMYSVCNMFIVFVGSGSALASLHAFATNSAPTVGTPFILDLASIVVLKCGTLHSVDT